MQELQRSNESDVSSSLARLRFARALDSADFEGAFQCLYESYSKRGLALEHPFKLRLTRHHLASTTRVFIACSGAQVTGTLSLVVDSPLAIPMRSIFDREINHLTGDSLRVAEATCLAVCDSTSASAGIQIVHGLMGMVAQAAALQGVAKILIAVHPRHAPFYTRAAGFKTFTSVKPYPVVGGAPAVALELNLQTLHVDAPEVYRRYFGMRFSPTALSSRPITPRALQRLTALWQDTHTDAEFLSLNSRPDRLRGVWPWRSPQSSVAAAG